MTACYTEIMSLGYKVTGAKRLGPLAWALFITQQYSFVGDKLLLYSGIAEEVCTEGSVRLTTGLGLLRFGEFPGWWAAIVAAYCPSRVVEHAKSKSTQPSRRPEDHHYIP